MSDGVPRAAAAPDVEAGPVEAAEETKILPESKRESMRKAGEAYFEKQMLPPSRRPVATTRSVRKRRGLEDPDILVVGNILEGGKMFFLAALFVSAQAIGICALKVR